MDGDDDDCHNDEEEWEGGMQGGRGHGESRGIGGNHKGHNVTGGPVHKHRTSTRQPILHRSR
jgi:hypothetical protein